MKDMILAAHENITDEKKRNTQNGYGETKNNLKRMKKEAKREAKKEAKKRKKAEKDAQSS